MTMALSFTPLSALAQTVTVVTEEWRPFNYIEDGEVRGMSTEIVKECLKRAQIDYKLDLVSWQRAYTEAKRDPNVLIYTITRTKERENDFHWVGKIAKSDMSLFRLKSRPEIIINSIEDLKKYIIAAPKDDAVHEKLLELGHPTDKIALTYGDKEHLTRLLNRSVDLLPANRFGMKDRFRNGRFSGASFSDLEIVYNLPVSDEGLYLAFSKKTSPELVERARNSFAQLEKEGLIKKMIDHYFEQNSKLVSP